MRGGRKGESTSIYTPIYNNSKKNIELLEKQRILSTENINIKPITDTILQPDFSFVNLKIKQNNIKDKI